MINIDDKTRRLSQATIVVGYKQENKAESIEFKIPEYLKEYGKKICFKTKDGKVFSKLFDNTTSNIFTFTRTETQYGELDATIEFFKTENEDMIIYKTSMLHIIFNESIICEDEVQPDEPKIPILESLIEKVTDLNNTITENEETRSDNENTRISNEDSRIANETQRDIYYTGIQNKVNNGEFNGATFTPSVDKDGNISWTNNKGLENPSSQNIRGPQGIQGAQGEPFKIKKTYPSVEAMQADFDNMEVGDYAMIVTSIELEDNAKLYSRTETEWVFITDFSGATGIQGPQGTQGIQGIQGERGIGISRLEVKDGYLYVTLTDNTQQNAGLIITDEVKQWLVTEITNNAESTFNQYYDTKVSEFNENVQAKLDEYNANAEALANKVVELETENTSLKNQIPSGESTGNPIHLTDSSDLECEIALLGNSEKETGDVTDEEGNVIGAMPSPDYPSEVETVGSNANLCDNSRILVGIDPQNSSEKDFRTSDYIKVEYGKTYVASLYNEKKVRIGNLVYNVWNKNLEKLGQITTDTIKITNQDIAYVTIRNYVNDAEKIKNEFYYKFEESLIATPYSPYGMGSVEISVDNGLETTDTNYQSYTKILPIQQEFVKINDTEDTFVKVDGKWYEQHNIKKLVLDGTEGWTKSSRTDVNRYVLNQNIGTILNAQTIDIICSHFKAITPSQSDAGNIGIAKYNNTGFLINIDINDTNFSTLEQFKAWLSTNNVTVYYVLATPELIECTTEQEKILNSFYTYKGVTNVSMSGIGKIKIIYKKDLETMFNNIIKQIPSSTSDIAET